MINLIITTKNLLFSSFVFIGIISCNKVNSIDVILYQAYADLEPKYAMDDYNSIEFYFLVINKTTSSLDFNKIQEKFKNILPLNNSKFIRPRIRTNYCGKVPDNINETFSAGDSLFFFKTHLLTKHKDEDIINYINNEILAFSKMYKDPKQSKFKVKLYLHKNFKLLTNDDVPDSHLKALSVYGEENIPFADLDFYKIFLNEYILLGK